MNLNLFNNDSQSLSLSLVKNFQLERIFKRLTMLLLLLLNANMIKTFILRKVWRMWKIGEEIMYKGGKFP